MWHGLAPAFLRLWESSEGRTNFFQLCVPCGTQRRIYSAATMPSAKDFGVRFRVENHQAAGFAQVGAVLNEGVQIRDMLDDFKGENDVKTLRFCRSSSTSQAGRKYSTGLFRMGLRHFDRLLVGVDAGDFAPRRVRGSQMLPPPQPISRRRVPERGPAVCVPVETGAYPALDIFHPRGIQAVQGANGPLSSHQRAESFEKF